MEIVLLWLDDLDDLVFSSALLWERLRRRCLQVGLVAVVSLSLCELSASAAAWTPKLTAVAVSSVGIWFFGALCVLLYRMRIRRPQALA
jgi:hypothetical protein